MAACVPKPQNPKPKPQTPKPQTPNKIPSGNILKRSLPLSEDVLTLLTDNLPKEWQTSLPNDHAFPTQYRLVCKQGLAALSLKT